MTTGKGWARIRHQNGTRINVSSESFIQFPDGEEDPSFKEDHLIVFKGQVLIDANQEDHPFSVVSATARAHFGRAQGIFIFQPENEMTQLIALKNVSTLENRFETEKKNESGRW